MNRQRDFAASQHCTSNTKSGTSSGTSDYSTCSDTDHKCKIMEDSRQSIILAGQIQSKDFTLEETEICNETSYSVDLLDKNVDICYSEEDVFIDCNNSNESDSNGNNTSIYLPLETMTKLFKMKSNNQYYENYLNANKSPSNVEEFNNSIPVAACQTEPDRLVTIMEETEVTQRTNSIFMKNKSPRNLDTTGKLVVEMVDEIKNCNRFEKHDRNSTKRVLFANEENIINGNQECKKILRKKKSCVPLDDKNLYSVNRDKAINENGKNHHLNTTESFILWENYLKSTEIFASRKSLSFTGLNSVDESSGADNEYSSSFKTLDDSILSTSFNLTNKKKNQQNEHCNKFSQKSKSCDNLLEEVRHLPHVIYDRFLKCLSKEIETMRKQNVVCTCKRSFKTKVKEKSNRENLKHFTFKPTSNKNINTRENHLSTKNSPLKCVTNQSRLTPDVLISNVNENTQRLSPKSPIKTPTNPSKKRGLYFWEKEVISPVGEYIRGKRQSPFQSSPSKK